MLRVRLKGCVVEAGGRVLVAAVELPKVGSLDVGRIGLAGPKEDLLPSCRFSGHAAGPGGIDRSVALPLTTFYHSSRIGAAESVGVLGNTAERWVAFRSLVLVAPLCRNSRLGQHCWEDRPLVTGMPLMSAEGAGGCIRQCYAGCMLWRAFPPAYGHSNGRQWTA